MKKSLIALAVAGAMTAPIVAQADATLYGSIRVGVANVDTGATDDWQVTDETSRIGIKGDVDLGLEGTTGFFGFETRLRADEGSFGGSDARLSYVGAKGDWGTAIAGRQYVPHYLWATSVADAMFNYASAGSIREVGLRQPNSIAYITPDMGGFQAAAAVVMGGAADYTGFGSFTESAVQELDADATVVAGLGGNNNDETADAYNIAAKYTAGGLHLAVSYMEVDPVTVAVTSSVLGNSVETIDYDALNFAASYSIDALKVFARYQDEELAGEDAVTTTQLGATYAMGDTILSARWSNLDFMDEVDGDQWMVGIQQNLGKRARVWVEYADVSSEIEDAADMGLAMVGGAGDAISIGYRLDF